MEKNYYRANGEIATALNVAADKAQKNQDARWEYSKRMGAKGPYMHDRGIVGLSFKASEDIPDGWKKDKDDGYYVIAVPDKRKKAGKLAAKEMADHGPLWELGDFYRLVEMSHYGIYDGRGMMLGNPGAHKIGDEWFVSIHAGEHLKDWKKPDDLKQIKTSEYWAAKEAQQEAKKPE